MIKQSSFYSLKDQKDMIFCMKISLAVGLLILILKFAAYYATHSAAILSDAAESFIHIFSVAFAAYSMKLSLKPADATHLYGHEKVNFFSAGFEGCMIIIAAFYIYFESIQKFLYGEELSNVNLGLLYIIIATFSNSLLSYFLIVKGKKYKSIILEANGRHVLTDCLTSFAVILSLVLIKITGILLLDPIIAILAATNILWTGIRLMKKSIDGLMDKADPILHRKIVLFLNSETTIRSLTFHHLRHRVSGHKVFIEFHLLFPNNITLERAHEIACEIEGKLQESLDIQAEIFSHLEPENQHDEIHEKHKLII